MIPKIIFNREKKDWVKRPLLSNIEKIIDYRGRTPKKLGLSWSDTGYLALSALNVKNGYIDFNVDANYGNQELYDRWMGDKHLHKGQVVFTTEAPMGNVAQIPNDDLYILSQRTIAFEVKHDLIREDFLATLLRSPKIFNELTSLSSGGTAKGVSQKSLSNLKVCVPASLEEQSAIGSLFRTLDDLLASYKDNLANYQSLKVTMLSKMFPKAGQSVPEIRLEGFEGEWKIKRADEIFKSVSEKNRALLPVLSASQIDGMVLRDEIGIDIKYDEATLNNYKVVKPGQFVIHLRSFQGGFALSKLEGITSPAYTIIDFIDKENHLSGFWNSILTSKEFIKRLETVTYGIRDGKSISFKDFSSLKFVFPNLEEQQAIGSYFSNLDNLIAAHQEKISQLETLKKKLLQEMFI
ncbi:restriction endonuclease subunit S [Streptococcus sp. HMSC056C01]|uniref:restriction endonuclease subunit S n=1 Tax=Streptococcus sp. HMSC056C01 TaxID=1739299 RepID=UPI0008CA2A1A|nr:restriction endonuclease subunit S [Streptococcus sp. HMSC056C01]OFK89885.1 hypothetical protein HMPREF2795_01685 [Streptococcus sp. HMSC056C01]